MMTALAVERQRKWEEEEEEEDAKQIPVLAAREPSLALPLASTL